MTSPDKNPINEIFSYMHCAECLKEKPPTEAPRTWARLEVGWTPKGLQVWCVRHNLNVVAIDLLGQKVDYRDFNQS